MENKKNTLVIILVVIIAILCLTIGWLLGSKFADKESEVLDDSTPNTEEKEENDIINFVGDKTTEVVYNPSYQQDHNLNYRINENNKLVYVDNNSNETIIYNSIQGNCRYVVLAVPYGKIEPYFEISAITTEGNIYYKEFYAYAEVNDANFSKYSSMNDNFKKIDNIRFNGIFVKQNIIDRWRIANNCC